MENPELYIGANGLNWKLYSASMTIDQFLLDLYLNDQYYAHQIFMIYILNTGGFTCYIG
jgi:hypothetical protein